MNGFKTLLFWATILLGAATLAPCLILPAWLERQAQLEYLKAHDEYLADLKYRLLVTQKQIEHVNNDPAYVLRLAQQEFGGSISVPNVQTIAVAPGPEGSSAPPRPPTTTNEVIEREEKLLPELSTLIEQTMQRYPHAQLFLDPGARPWLMGIGAMLLLTGIVLLGLVGESPPAASRKAYRRN